MIVILVIVGCLVVGVGSMLLRQAVATGLNRGLQRTTHREGISYAESAYFYNVDAPKDVVVRALRDQVTSRAEPPAAVVTTTYLSGSDEDTVVWAHGNKLSTAFEATARVGEANLEDGTAVPGVIFTFGEISTVDGVVAEVSAMRALKHDVIVALTSLDATCAETVIN